MLFGDASVKNAKAKKTILDQFCVYFGHKVNTSKSKIYLSTNTDFNARLLVDNILSFQQVEELGTYLGVPLFHRRVTKNMFQFLVDKMQKKLNGFDAKLLSMARRTVLAKSVLLAMLGYFMQSTMIPLGVCAQIEQIVRKFVLGSSDGTHKTTLVKWDTCCQPVMTSGLGLRRLIPLNSSFLMKLVYQIVVKKALWVRVMHSKYKMSDDCPISIDRANCSYVWRSLSKVWSQFKDRLCWSVRNGRSTRFLNDAWIPNLGPLANHLLPNTVTSP